MSKLFCVPSKIGYLIKGMILFLLFFVVFFLFFFMNLLSAFLYTKSFLNRGLF